MVTDKYGNDTINDFRAEDGDVIVNTSRSSLSDEDIDCVGDTCTIYLKGSDTVTVKVLDGNLDNGISNGNVINSRGSHTDFEQCKGHPLY